MKYTVANPIYDSVFKFLMSDNRVAKTILSALLKKDVLSVEMRRHEHPNITRDNISMFRIDFAAKVREDDGTERLILIELQKTWVDTETLRFRRYLAAQYNAEENMQSAGKYKDYAMPMVAIYLLGHRIGDIDKAVVYVNRKAFDYDGREIYNGEKDPFISSLTHDSIIVQIPLLHGKVNNKLDRVLSVFDQTRRDDENQHVVYIDVDSYGDDSEMMRIVHRLGLAAMSADVRQQMDDEDEFFSAIEARDTQVMRLNKLVSEKEAQLNEKEAQLNEKDVQLNEKDVQLNEKDVQLNEKDVQLNEKDVQLNEKEAQLNEKDVQLNEKEAQLNEKDVQLNEKDVQLNEKMAQIRAMAAAMLQNGLSVDVVASATGMSVDEVRSMLGL